MTTTEHAASCRQIARREEVPRLAEQPFLRLTCVHGHSWHVTEDGAPLPAPEARGWQAMQAKTALACRYCGVGPLTRGRKFCAPPRNCYRLWAREMRRKRLDPGAPDGVG